MSGSPEKTLKDFDYRIESSADMNDPDALKSVTILLPNRLKAKFMRITNWETLTAADREKLTSMGLLGQSNAPLP
jgi:hypothetical protein